MIKKNICFNGSTGSLGSLMPKNKNLIPCFARSNDSDLKIDSEIKKSNAHTFIHMAALTDIQQCEKFPERAREMNVEFPLRILKNAIKNEIQRFIFISSSHVYKPTDSLIKIKSSDKPDPQNSYGKSKLKAEKKLLDYSVEAQFNGLVIVRLFSLLSHKGRENFLLQSIEKRAKSKDFSYMPGIENVRDFIWADQACAEILKITQAHNPPGIINLCSGKGRKVKSLVKEVFDLNKIETKTIFNNSITGQKPNFLVGSPTYY
jgi:nucleoside-diphosphate-sugar epimerase